MSEIIILSVLFLLCIILTACVIGGTGKAIHSDSKELVCRVHNFFESEFENAKTGKPLLSVSQVWDRTSKATGLSKATIGRILKEKRETNKLKSPCKKRPRDCKKTSVDSFDRDAVRRLVLRLYTEGYIPSLNDIFTSYKESIDADVSRWAVWKIIKSIGFQYKKTSTNRSYLLERSDIVARRNQYLYKIKDLRMSGKNIIYLDETWVNAHMTRDKMWLIDTESPVKVPAGKGSRLIIVHAGGECGFINNGLLVFQSKSTKDYHEEMDSDRFLSWFKEQLLPNIPPDSCIVMDNASYHSRELNPAPTSKNRKCEMQTWLKEKQIPFDERMVKPTLYEIIKLHKPQFKSYEIDKLAESMGHTIVRLPPYHCEFNPIELIWAQVKDYVRKNNTKFCMSHVKSVFEKAISLVTVQNWIKACGHVYEREEFYWERDQLMDKLSDRLIINLEEDSSSSESEMEIENDVALEME